jgi:WD40 repeat protein
MTTRLIVLLLSAACGLISHFLHAETAASGCEAKANIKGICGFPAPEDIDVMPDGKHLLLSPSGGLDGEYPQQLYLFNRQSLAVTPVDYVSVDSAERWGQATCQTAPAATFGSHGIHISQRRSGQWQLLAVNHSRESVEFFEIIDRDQRPALAWRGCAIAPPQSSLNDVAALPDGGFLVTHMLEKGSIDIMAAMQVNYNTGFVWRWQPNKGFDKLPGSDGIVPNGIAISGDGRLIYVSETGGQQIRKLDYATGKQLASLSTGPVDNLSWAADGRLIATAITGPTPEGCFNQPGPCLTPFNVLAIDVDTMQAKVIHQQNGPPMGMASVAVLLDNYLYVGTFKGQQMMQVALRPKAPTLRVE